MVLFIFELNFVSRPGTAGNRLRPRSKSASLSGGRLNIGMQSILRSKASSTAEINDIGRFKIANLTPGCSMTKHPRISKSATYTRKSTVRNASDCQQQNMREIMSCQKCIQIWSIENSSIIVLASVIASDQRGNWKIWRVAIES